MKLPKHKIVLEKIGTPSADVAVAISLYNYEEHIETALQSVCQQDLDLLDLVVVEDRSADESLAMARGWLEVHGHRFNSFRLVQHASNEGLAAARNTGFSLAECEFVFVLDADNVLYKRCVGRCLEAIRASGAAFAYPILEAFGEEARLMGYGLWNMEALASGNYIDALSLIRTSAWKEVGGYSRMKVTGWEDYDLWCKFAERGFTGVQVPEILARYRVHSSSMLRSTTTTSKNVPRLLDDIQRRHPWLSIFPEYIDKRPG